MLSSRQGINLHLQEIKMDLFGGNENAIGVFVSGSETKQLGWIPKEIISEVDRMGQVQDSKISLITFKEKEISFHFSKIDCVNSYASPKFRTSSLKNIDTDCKNILLLILELMITIHAMTCDTYYVNLCN